MANLTLTHVPVANTGMLIRRPATDVFEALVDPAITSKFWFTNGSGRLEIGKRVRLENVRRLRTTSSSTWRTRRRDSL